MQVRDLELIDIPLGGRQFTWTNKREVPSFANLDTFFISLWDDSSYQSERISK